MIKEIGSEFWNIPTQDKDNLVFSDDTKWFISGRTALDFIIKDIKKKNNAKSVAMPSWCCDTMIKPFLRNGIEVRFYPVIIKDNKLDININVEADIVLIMNYFGYHQDLSVNSNAIIIEDLTHSIFTNSKHKADYYFGSLRKWAGFKTGGYAFIYSDHSFNENKDYYELRNKAMSLKEKYINNEITTKEYRDIFEDAEEKLDVLIDYSGNEKDIYDAKHLDIEFLKNKRRENAFILLESLKEYAIFKNIENDDCPLQFPIVVPNGKRDDLRRYLGSKNIYCPIHWPKSEYHKLDNDELFIYNNELSIVCDQRYSIEEMKYVSKCIKEFLGC